VGAVGEGGCWRRDGTKKRGLEGERNAEIDRSPVQTTCPLPGGGGRTREGWRYVTRQQGTQATSSSGVAVLH